MESLDDIRNEQEIFVQEVPRITTTERGERALFLEKGSAEEVCDLIHDLVADETLKRKEFVRYPYGEDRFSIVYSGLENSYVFVAVEQKANGALVTLRQGVGHYRGDPFLRVIHERYRLQKKRGFVEK